MVRTEDFTGHIFTIKICCTVGLVSLARHPQTLLTWSHMSPCKNKNIQSSDLSRKTRPVVCLAFKLIAYVLL